MICIKEALKKATLLLATNADSASLEAEVLLCSILNKQRSYLRTWPDNTLDTEQEARFWVAVSQRQQGQPIAYITGQREFWSRDFMVTPDVLIPRPDTELLIECALQLIPKHEACHILDLGTGSGIIAITLAAERPLARVSAVDISLNALKIAKQNAEKHRIKGIQFYQSNWFSRMGTETFDLIISNPPYIAANDPHLQHGDLRFEPKKALIASNNGLEDIYTLINNARSHLNPSKHLLMEHGYNQQQTVQQLFSQYDYTHIKTYTDLSGQPRVTYGQWLSQPL